MKRINIAFMVGSLTCGGAERQVIELINELDSKKFNRFIIVLWNNEDGFKNTLDKDVNYFSLQFRRRYFFYGFIKLLFFIYRNKINILHSHMYTSNLICSFASIFMPKCIFLTGEHGKNEWKRWHNHFIEKVFISRHARMRTSASNDIRELRIKFDGVNPEKIIFIPNGTSVKYYTKDNRKIPCLIGSLGRLVPVKDYFTLIDAVKIVRDAGFQLELEIAGQGDEYVKLEHYINSKDLAGGVRLLGYQNSDKFLRSIDLFAMSSLREGIPLALLEAMSYGLPCVATNVGGIPDVIQHEKNGLLSSPLDPSSLAKNIIRYVNDSDARIRMGNNAKKTIQDRFSINHVANIYSDLYEKLLISG